MTTADIPTGQAETDVLAALRSGDESVFGELTDRYRGELRVHCYRMLGSYQDAEDLVQEAYVRAWKHRASFEGRSTFRAWLYRIATNACLDHINRNSRVVPLSSQTSMLVDEVPWLQPFPDHALENHTTLDRDPATLAIERETVELAFIVAIQHLPARQRAVFILKDVLGWSAKEAADLLDTTVASVNSALQRARTTMKHLAPESRFDWELSQPTTEEETRLLQSYIAATESGDMNALANLMRDEVRFAMPPAPEWYQGRRVVIDLWTPFMTGPDRLGDFRLVPTSANRQPAAANYLRREGDTKHRAAAIDVLRLQGGLISDIVAFGPEVFPAFGLPDEL